MLHYNTLLHTRQEFSVVSVQHREDMLKQQYISSIADRIRKNIRSCDGYAQLLSVVPSRENLLLGTNETASELANRVHSAFRDNKARGYF